MNQLNRTSAMITRNMTRRPLAVIGVSAVALVLCGCISHKSTVVRDVERTPVEFENDTAARLFYEKLSHVQPAEKSSESTTEIGIPLVFEHKKHVVSGPNAAFNRAVETCDTNKDGKITELEARIYSNQPAK